jgi:hypothetical protein
MSIVRRNHAAGVNFIGPVLVERNVLRKTDGSLGEDFLGIDVVGGTGWIVRANDLSGFVNAIDVRPAASGLVEGNEVGDSLTGIAARGDGVRVLGNTVDGGGNGIVVDRSSEITGNTVEGAVVGMKLNGSSRATLRDNVLCGNDVNLMVAEGAEPVLEDNEICEDGMAQARG